MEEKEEKYFGEDDENAKSVALGKQKKRREGIS